MNNKLKTIIEEAKQGKGEFDVLVPYSGGKDSSYLLYLLSQVHGLRVAAVTVNHPFLNNLALENSKSVCRKLAVSHAVVDVDKDVFLAFIQAGLTNWEILKLTELAGCQLCGYFYNAAVRNIATGENIPFIFYGNDPTQVMGELEMARPSLPLGDFFQALVPKGSDLGLYNPEMDITKVREINYYAGVNYDFRDIRLKLKQLELLSASESDPLRTNCQIFHYFAKRAFEIVGRFPYQDMVDYGDSTGQATVLDQLLDTDTNIKDSASVIADYRKAVEAGSSDYLPGIAEGIAEGEKLFNYPN